MIDTSAYQCSVRARFCEYTVANAPKIVRMRLNKRPWSHFAFFLFIYLVCIFFEDIKVLGLFTGRQ